MDGEIGILLLLQVNIAVAGKIYIRCDDSLQSNFLGAESSYLELAPTN